MMDHQTSLRLQPRPYIRGPFTVEAPNYEPVDAETIPRRNHRTKDTLKLRPKPEITTIYDVLKYASTNFGHAKALGSRRLIRIRKDSRKVKKTVNGKKQEFEKEWNCFELGPYEYQSFFEFEQLALQVGAGLRKIGLAAPDRMHIFAATR